MNKIKLISRIASAVVGLTISSSVIAQDGPFFGNEAPGKWIIGAKAANIDPNTDGTNDASGYGIVLGYEFATKVGKGTSSFEIEYLTGDEENITAIRELGTIDGRVIDPRFGISQGDLIGNYEADVINAFFTYRSPGDLYYKVKAGLSYVDLNVSLVSPQVREFITVEGEDQEDVSLAAGIGLGYRISDLGVVELEYSQGSGDADVGILGLNALLQF